MIHVCLVDDDSLLLAGMQRVLRRASPAICLTVARSAAEALVTLQSQPVDVLVSDLCMPDVDGQALMATAQVQFPRTGRVIVTGALDPYRSFDLQRVAHRVITKPVAAADFATLLHEMGSLCAPAEPSVEVPGDLEIAWVQQAARQLQMQGVQPTQAHGITADIARNNPWLAMLLLQAAHGGFVSCGRPLDMQSVVSALGPVRLDIMQQHLHALLPETDDSTPPDTAGTAAMPAGLGLLDLTRDIAATLAPMRQESHPPDDDQPDETAGALSAHDFVAVAESAAVLCGATPAARQNGLSECDIVGHIAHEAALMGLPSVIVTAVRDSVGCADQPRLGAGTAVRWAAMLMRNEDLSRESDEYQEFAMAVPTATQQRWRELVLLAGSSPRIAS